MGVVKGLRVRLASDRSHRKGIAADSLLNLKLKVAQKFNLKVNSTVRIFLADGTEVDDEGYFQGLPQQSTLLVSEDTPPSQHRRSKNPYEYFALLCHEPEAQRILQVIREFLIDGADDKDIRDRWKTMSMFLDSQQQSVSCTLSTPDEDPKWFSNLSTNAKTKEEFMEKSCQARIRGYLSKAEIQIKQVGQNQKHPLTDFSEVTEKIFKDFRIRLKENKFYGHYFNRKSKLSDKICDSDGKFVCEGRFDMDSCQHQTHTINPYQSAEARILFSTWNLDHVIERSRSIVPALIEAVVCRQNRSLNVDYFHNLLFTRHNLKLVHIVCHDKQEHRGKKCDPGLCYLRSRNSQRRVSNKLSLRCTPQFAHKKALSV